MAKVKKEALGTVSGGVNPLEPQVTEHPKPLTAKEVQDYSFAVNIVKLNRAKAWVNQNAEVLGNPTGAKHTEAVKARYEAIGGLLVDDEPAVNKAAKASKKKGK